MQMILDYAANDLALWQAEFAARAEMRAQSGVSVLQIWRQEDASGRVLCLFEVQDRKRATDWLAVETALHGAGTAQFLRTL